MPSARKNCPICGSPLLARAPLCLQCGNHLGTGRRIPAAAFSDGITPLLRYVLAAGCVITLIAFAVFGHPRPQPPLSNDPTAAPAAPSSSPADWGADIDELLPDKRN